MYGIDSESAYRFITHRTWHHEYVILVTGCVLRGDLTAQFVYISNYASQSVERKDSI